MSSLSGEPELWKSLKEEEIREGCLGILEATDRIGLKARQALLRVLASLNKAREKTYASKKPADILPLLAKRIRSREFEVFRGDVVKYWILSRRGEMLAAFLDGARVPHAGGFVHDDYVGVPKSSDLSAGIRRIAGKYPLREVGILLGYMAVHGGPFMEHLGEALEECDDDLKSEAEPEGASAAPGNHDAPVPESSDEFTPLDDLLILEAVAAAFGETSAMGEEQLEEAVEELVRLDANRRHSLFHRGFFGALFNREPCFRFPGENDERRLWYLTGLVMGLLRHGESATVLRHLKEQSQLFDLLCKDGSTRCGIMLTPHLQRILWEANETDMMMRLLRKQLGRLPIEKRWPMVNVLGLGAADLIRSGNGAEAEGILNFLGRIVADKDLFPDELQARFLPGNERRKAQAQMLRGDFRGAEKLLAPLTAAGNPRLAGEASADLALIKGGFRSLAGIFPLKDEADGKSKTEALMKGRIHLEAAIASEGDEVATNARLCSGIISMMLGGDPQAAADHFSTSLSGMMSRQSAYEVGGIMDWTKLLLAITILERADPGGLHYAGRLVEEVLSSSSAMPAWLWVRALRAASLFDDQDAATRIAGHLLATLGRDAADPIWDSGLPKTNAAIMARYLEWLGSPGTRQSDRWDRSLQLLPAALRLEPDRASLILDALESMALEEPLGRGSVLCRLLEDEDNYSPAWTRDDAVLTTIGILESAGRLEDAVAVIKGMFYRYHAKGDVISKAEATGMLEWIREVLPDDPEIVRMENLVSDQIPAEVEDKDLPVKVVYVGGNETQERYESDLRRELTSEYPNLALEFHFTKWTSNWNKHLERVVSDLSDADALVLNKLVRTNFGRSVRKECDGSRPWFACTGRGKDSLKRSIGQAVRWAISTKEG